MSYVIGLVLALLGTVVCFQQGVIFEGGRDVLLTDSYWRIHLQYNLTQMQEESQNLSIILDEVKGHYETFFKQLLNTNMSMNSPILTLETGFRFEYANMHLMVVEYLNQVSDLVTLLPRQRPKRGLVDAGGHLLKFLFGTLDSSDLERMSNKLDSLNDATNEAIHNSNEQVSILANMHLSVVSHTKSINTIISTLKDYHKEMHQAMTKVFDREVIAQNQLKVLFKYLKISSALSDIKYTIDCALQRMIRFHQAIEDLASGKVRSSLLYPHEFLEILKSIEKVLHPPAKLFLPVTLDNIHQYYSVATVQSYSSVNTLRVIIQVPLKIEEKLFQYFSVVSYPVFNPSLGRWTQWELGNQKLLVSKDRLSYTLYDEAKFLRECRVGELIVCPLSEMILNVQKRASCIVNLFVTGESKLCKRKLVTGLETPLLIKTSNRWLYSTSTTHKLTLNCYSESGHLNISTQMINGTGEVKDSERCDIITSDFKVPARIHGSTNFLGQMGELKFPDVKAVLSDSELDLITSDLNTTLNILQDLDEQLGTASIKECDLEDLFSRLRSHREYRKKIESIILPGIGVTTCIILIALCAVYRNLIAGCLAAWFQRCRTRRQSRRDAAYTRALRRLGVLSNPQPGPQSEGEESRSHP